VREGSLYPVLYKLEDNHYITSKEVRTGKRRIRKYYHIEDKGKIRLEILLSDYKLISEAIEKILSAEISKTED